MGLLSSKADHVLWMHLHRIIAQLCLCHCLYQRSTLHHRYVWVQPRFSSSSMSSLMDLNKITGQLCAWHHFCSMSCFLLSLSLCTQTQLAADPCTRESQLRATFRPAHTLVWRWWSSLACTVRYSWHAMVATDPSHHHHAPSWIGPTNYPQVIPAVYRQSCQRLLGLGWIVPQECSSQPTQVTVRHFV